MFSPPTDSYRYQPGAEEKAALWERRRFGAGQKPSLRALGFFEFFGEGGNSLLREANYTSKWFRAVPTAPSTHFHVHAFSGAGDDEPRNLLLGAITLIQSPTYESGQQFERIS